MINGTYMHEELADRGFSQRDEAELTNRKLEAYHAQKDKDESDDEGSEDDDDDDDEAEEEDDKDESEEEPAKRRHHTSKLTQEALLDQVLGPDLDSNDSNGNPAVTYEDCTLASLYCIY
jgi:hypothetical protein